MRAVLLGLVAMALMTIAGLMVMARLETGRWSPPDVDLIRVPVQKVLGSRRPRLPRTIVLWRGGATVEAGDDDSHALRSSIVRSSNRERATVPRFSGGDRRWKQLVACVRTQFAPFDVTVVEERPPTAGYVLALIGGTASVLGRGGRVAGLAPYSSRVVEDPIVFVFSGTLGNAPQATCETAAMEIAHAYGLDHAMLCSDVMSYLRPCGRRGFQPKAAPCGESSPRACGDGRPTQNSHERLLELLGPARPAPKAR